MAVKGLAAGLVIGILLLVTGPPGQAVFPGANGRIVFVGAGSFSGPSDLDPTGRSRSLSVVAPGGFGQRALLECVETDGEPAEGDCGLVFDAPAWSPDGTLLAFDGGTRIAVMRRDGSGLRRLPAATADDGEPAFAPRGRRLVISGPAGPGSCLSVLRLGGGTRKLTCDAATGPAWSVRGWIAFARGGDLFAIRPDGTGLRRIVRQGSGADWSPGGRRLAFVRGGRLHVFSGGRARLLRRAGGSVRNVAWSPDGRRIAFESDDGIRTIRTTGAGVRIVVENQAGDSGGTIAGEPAWQPRRP